MSSNIPKIPPVLGATIPTQASISQKTTYNRPGDPWDGYPYRWQVQFNIVTISTSELPNQQFDGADVKVGQWYAQSSGFSWRIVEIVSVASNTEMVVVLEDVDLYNLSSDPAQSGNNQPLPQSNGVIFSLSEDGNPILTYLSSLTNLQSISYWINDALGRFEYTNYYEEYYTNNLLNSFYSGYSVGQVVYIGQTGSTYMYMPVDSTNTAQAAKAFGIVSSVNQPSLGNMYVRPFGKVIADLPYNLPGNIGDALYYSSTNPPSYCTHVIPTVNPIKLYIKLDTNIASVLYGHQAGGGGTGTAGPITSPTLENSYLQNAINLDLPISINSPLNLGHTVTITKPCNIWVSASLNFISSDTRTNTIFAFSSINGVNSNIHTSSIVGLHSFNQFGYLQFSFQQRAYCGVTGTIPINISMFSTTNTSGLVKLQEFNIFALGNL